MKYTNWFVLECRSWVKQITTELEMQMKIYKQNECQETFYSLHASVKFKRKHLVCVYFEKCVRIK